MPRAQEQTLSLGVGEEEPGWDEWSWSRGRGHWGAGGAGLRAS